MTEAEAPLKKTPLNDLHRQLGAKMVPFGGWDMPVQYTSILEEHRAVRGRAGLFDVSHMGEFEFRGPQALAAVQRLTSNDASRLGVGQIQYAALTTEAGTFVDDLTVYRLGDDHFRFTVNAANIDKDWAWVVDHVKGLDVQAKNISLETALLAVQGPEAVAIVRGLTPVDLSAIRYYWFGRGPVMGIDAILSRTGYTGEDGFEIYVPWEAAPALWNRILEGGKPRGILPAGLGARDTLRLEAKMALYGHDIDEEHTILEADLGWIIKWEKGPFIGREALERQRGEGIRRKLVGFEMVGRGIARQHYPILKDGRPVGEVTSGGPAPWLNKHIGLGYVPIECAPVGTEIDILIRDAPVRARVVPTPFYKRPRK